MLGGWLGVFFVRTSVTSGWLAGSVCVVFSAMVFTAQCDHKTPYAESDSGANSFQFALK